MICIFFIADETKKEDSTKDAAKNDTKDAAANKKQPDPPKSPSKNKPEPPKSPAKNKPLSESIDTTNLLKEAKAKADTASILKSPMKSNNKNKNNKGQSSGKRYVHDFCTYLMLLISKCG